MSNRIDTNEIIDCATKSTLIAGGVVLAYGLIKNRRLLLTAAFGGMSYALVNQLMNARPAPRVAMLPPTGTPSFAHDDFASNQEPMDEIDEAAMESFPASDPPASHRRA